LAAFKQTNTTASAGCYGLDALRGPSMAPMFSDQSDRSISLTIE